MKGSLENRMMLFVLTEANGSEETGGGKVERCSRMETTSDDEEDGTGKLIYWSRVSNRRFVSGSHKFFKLNNSLELTFTEARDFTIEIWP
jgi:hypothetical protein